MQNGTLNTEGNAASNAAGPSSSSSSSSYYYKDYVAPLVLEENGINASTSGLTTGSSSSASSSLQPGNAAAAMGDRDNNATTSSRQNKNNIKNKESNKTRSRSSARHATPLPSSTSSLTVIPSSVSPRSHSLPPLSASQQPVKIKLTLVPDEENENVNTSMTVSSPSALSHAGHPSSLSLPASRRHLSAPLTSTTTDDDASDDGGGHSQLGDLDNDNDSDDEEEANQSMNGDNSLDSLGYPSKLPFWVSANLVVRHPSSKDKETCLACMQELKEQREALDSEADKESEDWKARSVALEEKIKDAYWLTNGNGRFRHMSECTHQSQDTREKAKIRLDRYLAMARQRMKARHQREKLEKKKRLAGAMTTTATTGPAAGLTVNTALAAKGGSASGQTTNGTTSGRQSSADRTTPEPSATKSSKKMNPKKVAAMAMNEDLRALSIMPGNKKRETTVKGKASVMNTYENDFTDDEADLADLPPPMLHDSGSERSPSVPPEPVKTPHSVSFRVTNEPYIYIKDSLHPSMLNRDEHSSFFAASACLYASQGDSSKITPQTFFDTPIDHSSSGIGSRKRSPHHNYYHSRREENKRRRVTPDVPKRALAPPRTVVMKRAAVDQSGL
ncbi:hypothetical protein P389DRAFT_196554 [Cystobasidium minutum MCA 4210]|uniref:uncharacterized protein n=1 Tax=Cystobasidium minutum MCA 4210 TaxID=1397322 RepID=UPI0034CE4A2E|eukprot:jgi/Rhomi1/196554/gm1.4768_g